MHGHCEYGLYVLALVLLVSDIHKSLMKADLWPGLHLQFSSLIPR